MTVEAQAVGECRAGLISAAVTVPPANCSLTLSSRQKIGPFSTVSGDKKEKKKKKKRKLTDYYYRSKLQLAVMSDSWTEAVRLFWSILPLLAQSVCVDLFRTSLG
ncbi:hypothetical protein AWENTII_011288 [Aspergillus wentii]